MKQELLKRLSAFDQQHLLHFWDDLNEAQQTELAAQIASVDFPVVSNLVREPEFGNSIEELARRAEPPLAIRLNSDENPFDAIEAKKAGSAALAAGTVGAALVAGGQGTRLGFDHPKGMFSIGPVSGASLFQIHVEKLRALSRRFDVRIPLYLMTSPATDAETREYFDRHDRFGLADEDLFIFCQGTMPAVAADTGRLLMTDRHRLFQSPDGHGGMLAALDRSGALADMQHRGIGHLFYFQVDNPLATICDSELIGYHLLAASQYTLQVVAKNDPLEKVGNIVSVDEALRVIEYSDLPDDVALQRNADGSLKLWAGNIAVHVFDVGFLNDMCRRASALPFHRALKEVAHIDAAGATVQPAEANAIKFERFIFDLLPSADRALAVESDALLSFAPLKNATGSATDTPESVQSQIMDLHRGWLHAAGADVGDEARVEISPLFALDAEELSNRVPSGSAVTQSTYFAEH
jgi:UDP-N-acetylglucosamine/UDP-N-acetylgalactosamine diphosphorylase